MGEEVWAACGKNMCERDSVGDNECRKAGPTVDLFRDSQMANLSSCLLAQFWISLRG